MYGKEPGTSKLPVSYVTRRRRRSFNLSPNSLAIFKSSSSGLPSAHSFKKVCWHTKEAAPIGINPLSVTFFFNSINVSSMSRFPYVATRTTGVFKPEKRLNASMTGIGTLPPYDGTPRMRSSGNVLRKIWLLS